MQAGVALQQTATDMQYRSDHRGGGGGGGGGTPVAETDTCSADEYACGPPAASPGRGQSSKFHTHP